MASSEIESDQAAETAELETGEVEAEGSESQAEANPPKDESTPATGEAATSTTQDRELATAEIEAKPDERPRVFVVAEIDKLRDEARRLWPLAIDRIPAIESWIDRAAPMKSILDELSKSGSALSSAAGNDGKVYVLDSDLGDAATLRAYFEGPADPSTFAITGTSFPEVSARLERIKAASQRSNEVLEAWSSSIERAKSIPPYAGLSIRPLPGWEPVGLDPDSGLLEMAWLPSGKAPRRDEKGRLLLTADSALVFVLLPGGEFDLGEQRDDPFAPNYLGFKYKATGYSWSTDLKKKTHTVMAYSRAVRSLLPTSVTRESVVPFLISKYEVTRAQWSRVMGRVAPPSDESLLPQLAVTWDDAWLFSKYTGMQIPTERQWESAARGPAGRNGLLGGLNPFPLLTSANVRGPNWQGVYFPGEYPERKRGPWGQVTYASFWVPETYHGPTSKKNYNPLLSYNECLPVGSRVANRFGLHDIIGNAAEWCRLGAAQTQQSGRQERIVRGGSWNTFWCDARATHRTYGWPAKNKNHSTWKNPLPQELGLRPVLKWRAE